MRIIKFFMQPQLIRYSIVGGASSIVHFIMVLILVENSITKALLANLFGYLSGFLVSYNGHRVWTFPQSDKKVKQTLPQFLLIVLLTFFLNQNLYYFLMQDCHISYSVALAIVLLIMAAFSYTINKLWVFNKKHPPAIS